MIYMKFEVTALSKKIAVLLHITSYSVIQGGAQNVIPLIVHVTHFYYYKNI